MRQGAETMVQTQIHNFIRQQWLNANPEVRHLIYEESEAIIVEESDEEEETIIELYRQI